MAGPTRDRSSSRKRARGFTLIEIMVVIVIMGVLAALIVPRVMNRPDEARVIAAKQDIASVMQALKLYRLDNQRYPTTEQGLQALVTRPTTGADVPNWKALLDKVPIDPWGKPYQFLNPGVKGEIDVFSFGADGRREVEFGRDAVDVPFTIELSRDGAKVAILANGLGLFEVR